jgi:hypothetical protein
MNTFKYKIHKINILLLMMSVSLHLVGQSKSADSISNNFVSEDTIISENILKTPELQAEKTPENVSPNSPMIPMPVPGLKQPNLLTLPRYLGYEGAKNMFLYKTSEYEPGKINLNLNLQPPKSILDLIRENPLRALVYGIATLAGMANNNIVGEDKMNIIRLNNMIQSRSGIPETAISGHGTIHYEINVNRRK